MTIILDHYRDQAPRWPQEGRHILAQHDDATVIVYQAYHPSIADYAIRHGAFGGTFSFSRMSWIKPNFLWMMFRSGWGTKPDQEATLGLRLRRAFFENLLAQAVASSFSASGYDDAKSWKAALAGSTVRLQWDPDHGPSGKQLKRRAIQLGLRGETLAAFGGPELLEVIDMTAFVAEQRQRLAAHGEQALETPREAVFLPLDASVRQRLRLSP